MSNKFSGSDDYPGTIPNIICYEKKKIIITVPAVQGMEHHNISISEIEDILNTEFICRNKICCFRRQKESYTEVLSVWRE